MTNREILDNLNKKGFWDAAQAFLDELSSEERRKLLKK